MKYAPILISVYNRKDHLTRLIDSLQKNLESKYSDLFVVSDAAHNIDNIKIVTQVRKYVSELTGFNSIEIIDWPINKGSYKSILDAINYVFKKHERLIFLEDDNIVSENFLAYLNEGLTFYNDNKSIFSISGFNYPIKIKFASPERSYFYKGYSAWGVGMWKDKWDYVSFDIDFEVLKKEIKDNKKNIETKLGEKVYITISSMCDEQIVFIDALISYYIFKNNWFSVFPEVTKVKNYGHDGLGEHGGKSLIYVNQKIDSNNFDFIFEKQIIVNSLINKQVLKYFSVSYKGRVKRFLNKAINIWR